MEKGNNVEDLMGLIELAEKSTEKLDKLKNKLFLNNFGIIIFLIINIIGISYSYYAYQSEGIVPIDLLLIIGFLLLIVVFYFQIKNIRNAIKIENRVLDKLYNLIDPLKSQIRDEISIMKMAAIEIRLSRIDYGSHQKREDFSKPVMSSTSEVQKELNFET